VGEQHLLARIGVYGYDHVAPIILAALITEDPLLLIGKAGTGKTFLLNSLSEALGLQHRHYNASLIAFDDLVGFPYPTPDHASVRYLQTPATIWAAESVLVDEISRCKPEHQNRLFSLIHERRIQGLKLEALRYRWAAMNPCSLDQGLGDSYDGSEPLDQALADRFAFIVDVPDWAELDEATQRSIADPRGDGLISDDGGAIARLVTEWQDAFRGLIATPPAHVIEYCRVAATVLGESNLRISPRRVRQLVKNVLAVSVQVRDQHGEEERFLLALRWSLPQRAWGVIPTDAVIHAAHRTAWDAASLQGRDQWLSDFHLERRLSRKIHKLVAECPDPDTGTLAVTQLLATEPPARAAAFAFTVYPAALEGRLPIGREGINDLGKLAGDILDVRGEIAWQERRTETETRHPEYSRLSKLLASLPARRRERATQIFYYLLVNNIALANPVEYEEEVEACVAVLRP